MIVPSLLTPLGSLANATSPALPGLREPIYLWPLWLPWALGGGLIGLIALIFIWRWWRRRHPARPTESLPLCSPYQLAQQGLLAARVHLRPGAATALALALSDTLRTYVEAVLQIPAPEMTTEEFLPHALKHPLLRGDSADRLQRFLQACDLVKFARQDLDTTRMEELWSSAERFVEDTHQQLETEAASRRAVPQPRL